MEITTNTIEVSGDGAMMPIYVAEPKGTGPYPVVIVFVEAFGVNEHIKDVTRRLAAEGYLAVCPDLFYRQGKRLVFGYDEIPKVMPVMQKIYDGQTNADVRCVIDHVKRLKNAKADRIGCTGYCMGGTVSWLSACLNTDI